jgi:signal transduction histidine kinase
MAAATGSVAARRRSGLPVRSARLRLTLIYSGLFLALGTTVVAVIFVLARGGSVQSSVSQAVPVPAAGPAVHAVASQQHSADVARLLAVSWLTLVLTAVAATVLGWFAAGRALRPLRQMTEAARNISAGNLHARLALAGPDDEFKQLGDTFDELLARLEMSFAAQRRFVTNAAHELRTPLTLERTLLQVALADPRASAGRLRATCEELLASGRDQERLLEALLTLASSERGLERHEPVDLVGLVRPALRNARDEIERRALTVDADLRPVAVRGDPDLLARLIANLVDNAARYNVAEGRVTIHTGTESGRAVLSVANTGPQVPREEIARLFEPFERLGAERTGSDGHHGLGLSIVRAIATAHNATVGAEPRPDGGLVVRVSFPSRRGLMANSARSEPPTA